MHDAVPTVWAQSTSHCARRYTMVRCYGAASTYDDAPENGPRMYAMKLNWRTRCMMIGTWCADKQNDAMNISIARMQSNCVDSTPHLTSQMHNTMLCILQHCIRNQVVDFECSTSNRFGQHICWLVRGSRRTAPHTAPLVLFNKLEARKYGRTVSSCRYFVDERFCSPNNSKQ